MCVTWPLFPSPPLPPPTNHQVRLWDLRTSKASKTVRTEGENINLAWSPDGLYLAVGNRDEVLSFIDARKGTVLKTIRCPTEVNEVKWSPSGSLFFLTLGSGKVRKPTKTRKIEKQLSRHTFSGPYRVNSTLNHRFQTQVLCLDQ